MPFDLEAARESGYSDAEIIDHLRNQRPNFDVDGARESGYDDGEIAKFMATGEGYDRSAYGVAGAVPRGANTMLANVLGAPVDLINAGMGAVGLPTSETPVGGSESIRTLMDQPRRTVRSMTGQDPNAGPEVTYDSIDDLPREERIGAVAGEVMGGALPFAMAPLAAARFASVAPRAAPSGNVVQEGVRSIVNTAGRNPGRFAATEAAMAGGAAQGAAAAETVAPGNDVARMSAEMAGALFNPAGMAMRGAGRAGESIRNATSQFTPGGTRRRAEEYIQRAFAETGEDPEPVIRALRQDDGLNLDVTAGQRSGSPTALAIEGRLGRENPAYGRERELMGRGALDALVKAADNMAASGDPGMVREAARIRANAFDEVIGERIGRAEAEAREAMDTLAAGGQAEGTDASQRASDILHRALRDVRNTEDDLWNRVPKDVQVQPNSTLSAYDDVRSRMLEEENLPGVFEGVVSRLRNKGRATANEINIVRSRALSKARELRAAQQWSDASALQDIADGALKDLMQIEGNDAADTARQFSRTLNQRFSQTFAGRAVGADRTGANRVSPEVMLDRAFGSGGRQGALRMNEVQRAALFGDEATGGSRYAGPMLESQESFMRSRAGTLSDPETGTANPRQMATFQRNNQQLLRDRFPDLANDIDRAMAGQRAMETVRGRGERASQVLPSRSALGRLLRANGDDDVVSIVGQALKQGPQNYRSIANLARRQDNPEALRGLGSATLDSLMTTSRSRSGDFSFTRFREELTRPGAREGSSPLDLMRETGAMDEGQIERLNTIIERGAQIENADSTAREINQLVSEPDALTDLVVRIAGANMGSAGAAGQGAPLIAASAGSRTARNIFQKVPAGKIKETLIEITRDPELFAAALERAPTPARRNEIERQINAALINAGIVTPGEGEDQSE